MGNTKELTPKRRAKRGKRLGRPPMVNEQTLDKLLQAFALGATDREACYYAGITPATLYKYQDRNPKFYEQKEALKEKPVLMARQKVVNDLANNVETAKWYLERKKRGEFSVKVEQETNINLTFNNGVPRPKVIEGNTTYSVPAKRGGNN